ncbi:MAG: hypothetical protein B7Z40_18615, partial [Bosea sp. 12-68-7]
MRLRCLGAALVLALAGAGCSVSFPILGLSSKAEDEIVTTSSVLPARGASRPGALASLTSELGPNQLLDEVTQSSAAMALTGATNARKTVEAGFTTVADLGAENNAIFALRNAIARGAVIGPRIIASGAAITPTGGHGDVQGYREDINHVLASPAACNGADDCRRAVRAQVQRGA